MAGRTRSGADRHAGRALPLAAIGLPLVAMGALGAVDADPPGPGTPAPGAGPTAGVPSASRRFGSVAASEQRFLFGELLLEGIYQDNYTDGGDGGNDRATPFWIRARLGAKVEVEDSVELRVGVVYEGEGGDHAALDADNKRSPLAMNDAYIIAKRFVWQWLDFKAGRQPVAWNLRQGRGALVFDSRSHPLADAPRPLVTSWDGLKADIDISEWTISPFMFVLNESRETAGLQRGPGSTDDDDFLYGVNVDWRPDAGGDDNAIVSLAATAEENPPITRSVIGDRLFTFYAGGEIRFQVGLDFYAEIAKQDGKLGDGRGNFSGMGGDAGLVWHLPGDYQDVVSTVGLQFDYLSGDTDPTDDDCTAFVNTWEGTNDTLIVEDERYGELSELLVGDLKAVKGRIDWSYFRGKVNLAAVGALYWTQKSLADEDWFGQEYDLRFVWRYNRRLDFQAFGGVFLPGGAYAAAADQFYARPAGDTGRHGIYLLGINAHLSF